MQPPPKSKPSAFRLLVKTSSIHTRASERVIIFRTCARPGVHSSGRKSTTAGSDWWLSVSTRFVPSPRTLPPPPRPTPTPTQSSPLHDPSPSPKVAVDGHPPVQRTTTRTSRRRSLLFNSPLPPVHPLLFPRSLAQSPLAPLALPVPRRRNLSPLAFVLAFCAAFRLYGRQKGRPLGPPATLLRPSPAVRSDSKFHESYLPAPPTEPDNYV
ncbi:hypothetical protein V9T40_010630 [Parthenolecanium corni]|uniref:Uncharacterized protein n=1 Tax=Parthenolecanium corni TaxID=536013 RepID=A0AAN9T5A7_9HEMI